MEPGNGISFFAAFAGGLLTFLSPCLLPLVPAYLSYMTGISPDELKTGNRLSVARRALIHALFFTAGFSIVFVLLGASITYLGQVLAVSRIVIERIGGVLIILFGLYMTGLIRLGFLDKERKMQATLKKGTVLNSLLLGVTFAAAWTPCVGPILGSILVLAGTKETLSGGIMLLAVFSLGLAIPFILSAVLINVFLTVFDKMKKFIGAIRFVSAALLIFVGILLVTGRFNEVVFKIINFFAR